MCLQVPLCKLQDLHTLACAYISITFLPSHTFMVGVCRVQPCNVLTDGSVNTLQSKGDFSQALDKVGATLTDHLSKINDGIVMQQY